MMGIIDRDFCSFVFKVLSFSRLKYLLPADFDDDFHLEILKEALLRAIQDIDITFSKVSCILCLFYSCENS